MRVSDALAQVLVRRGYAEPDAASAFLAAGEFHELDEFAGLREAAETILASVRAGEQITIHGDYDVDGVCSTAILLRTLRKLGAKCDWYLPDRASDGYGLSAATVRRLASAGTRLLITVDCAITAVEEVALARSLGVETIVTDHHLPRADGQLPDAPIVHPALCDYACRELCAAAVAYKLAQATLRAAGGEQREVEQDLDLVALATIADVVALVGENRCARPSRPARARGHRQARAARVDVGGRRGGRQGGRARRRVRAGAAHQRGRAPVPRRRGAGAAAHERPGARRRGRARARPRKQRAQAHRADHPRAGRSADRATAERSGSTIGGERRSAFVLAGEGWHPGVIGIVASRLAERHRRPVVMIALDTREGTPQDGGDAPKGAGKQAASSHAARDARSRGMTCSRD